MKQLAAVRALHQHDLHGRYVFATSELRRIFREDSPKTLAAGLRRLVREGVLIRASRGVYVFAFSRHRGGATLEEIAVTMRRGEYSYLSLESALSEYGIISQIPLGRITVMTTGRGGEYHTPFGVIEFTHTKRPLGAILDGMLERGSPLRIAKKETAWRDLKRVGRNTDLADKEALDEYGII